MTTFFLKIRCHPILFNEIVSEFEPIFILCKFGRFWRLFEKRKSIHEWLNSKKRSFERWIKLLFLIVVTQPEFQMIQSCKLLKIWAWNLTYSRERLHACGRQVGFGKSPNQLHDLSALTDSWFGQFSKLYPCGHVLLFQKHVYNYLMYCRYLYCYFFSYIQIHNFI